MIKLNGFIATQAMVDAVESACNLETFDLDTIERHKDALVEAGNVSLPCLNEDGERVQHGARTVCDGIVFHLENIERAIKAFKS